MRRRSAAFCSIFLVIALCLSGTAAADFSAFSDVQGHWAETVLSRAYEDGYLQGYEDNTLRPDDTVTTAQVLVVLYRARKDSGPTPEHNAAMGNGLKKPPQVSPAEVGTPEPEPLPQQDPLAVPEDAWYYAAAADAYARGLIPADPGDLEQPANRAKAFVLSAQALEIPLEDAGFSALSRFSDAYMLDRDDIPVIAGLVSGHLIEGDSGLLRPRDSITRAEFLTIFYRLLDSLNGPTDQEVLAAVTTGYQGDWTLEWAEQNDYSPDLKERWVAVQGYESESDYLIWVSIACQRVNIFKGTNGVWELERSCIVGTGAPGYDTPVGVWQITYKNYAGWTTATYTVKPVVGFKGGGYAFHSRLYAPGTTIVGDASIGYPVSHGCIRMYDEDIQFIYDSIPVGTTVVVY
jgi:hypothetical protein